MKVFGWLKGLFGDPANPSDIADVVSQAEVGGLRVHSPQVCAGRPCPVHNPSDHHMRTWPTNYRMDWPIPLRNGRYTVLTERICQHGVGHPDPDCLEFLRNNATGPAWVWATHGCDGCCTLEETFEPENA